MRYERVLLVFPDYKGGHFGALRPPAGLGYLARALADSRIDYEICDMAVGYGLKHLANLIRTFDPDLLGISIMSFMYGRSYEIIRFAKTIKSCLAVVAGGPHISTVEDGALKDCQDIDYGIVMEGEEAVIELCKDTPLSAIKGLIYREEDSVIMNERREFISELDKVGFPTYDKFPLKRYVTEEIGIVSSRGCPYNCIYCPVQAAIGRRWRKRSADSIVRQIEHWYGQGYRQFSILDDNFTLDKKRVLEICEKICACNFDGLELNCNNGIRADNVDREILEAMKQAGFRYLAFGVESGNNKVLENIGKGESLEVIKEAVQIALELGYKVTLFFLIGSPTETAQDVDDSIRLATQYPVFDARFYNLIPFPKSTLYDWVKENNYFLVRSEDYLNDCSQWDNKPVFETPHMDRMERTRMLRKARRVRKRIRYNSMKAVLRSKLGLLAAPIARIYVNDCFQKILMKNRFLRKNLKVMFRKVAEIQGITQ